MVEVKYKQQLDPLLMELKELVLGKLNDSFSQGGIMFLGTKGYYVYPILRIGEINFKKKIMVLGILYIWVPQKSIMTLEWSTGGMV